MAGCVQAHAWGGRSVGCPIPEQRSDPLVSLQSRRCRCQLSGLAGRKIEEPSWTGEVVTTRASSITWGGSIGYDLLLSSFRLRGAADAGLILLLDEGSVAPWMFERHVYPVIGSIRVAALSRWRAPPSLSANASCGAFSFARVAGCPRRLACVGKISISRRPGRRQRSAPKARRVPWDGERARFSAPSKDRTCDLGFRKALLYPTELRGRAAEAVTSVGDAQALSRFTRHF